MCVFRFPDDPYYCGMRARVPNFVSAAAANGKAGKSGPSAGGGAATGWPGYGGGGGAAKENQHQMAAGVKARINSKHNAQQQVSIAAIFDKGSVLFKQQKQCVSANA